MDSGDGKTCKTGWEVAAIGEEYFVLNLLGVVPKQQSLVTGSPSCDVLQTTDKDGKSAVYFFRFFNRPTARQQQQPCAREEKTMLSFHRS